MLSPHDIVGDSLNDFVGNVVNVFPKTVPGGLWAFRLAHFQFALNDAIRRYWQAVRCGIVPFGKHHVVPAFPSDYENVNGHVIVGEIDVTLPTQQLHKLEYPVRFVLVRLDKTFQSNVTHVGFLPSV